MRWVVVGGGVAGCVVAARLSEDTRREVVLLEAGPDHGTTAVPGDVGPFFGDPARIRVEQVVRRPGADPEPYRQGFGLGGSSLINGGLVASSAAALPTEPPWSVGAVGRALLASDPAAAVVPLARSGRVRTTVADAYLRPVLDRPNLSVRTGVEVRRVRFRGRVAVGVELSTGEVVDADRVVLSAGAIRTPTLLLRSGVDTPGVGEGLGDHPAFTVTLRLRAEAVDATVPTISVVAGHGDHQVLALDHLPGTPEYGALTIGLLDVRSTGRVSLPEPDGEPLVELAQLTERIDAERLSSAVLATLDRLADPAWTSVVADAFIDTEGTPVSAIAGSIERVSAWVPTHLGGHHHVAGTCAEGVVTDGGRVRGYEGLAVCDASLFPGVPQHNPFAAVIELAERTVASW
jgi:choline dehydrogenase-like flavoprotein